MIKNPTIPAITDPQLLDVALAEINGKLTAALTWLDYAFGKAYALDGENRVIPAIYTGATTEYLKLLPDAHIGNFSFFDVEDGEQSEWTGRNYDLFTTSVSLIFWFDFRDIYPNDHKTRTTENVKAAIYRTLKEMQLTKSSISFTRIYEKKDEVFRGYEMPDSKFYMRPYGQLRFEGEIMYKENHC